MDSSGVLVGRLYRVCVICGDADGPSSCANGHTVFRCSDGNQVCGPDEAIQVRRSDREMGMSNETIARAGDVWGKVEKVRVGMLTLAAPDGDLNSRPMTIQQVEAPGIIWFFTSHHGALAHLVEGGAAANLSVSDPDNSLYVSVSGNATLVDDRAKVAELWSTLAKAWFPGGVDDPNLALLKLDVRTADYWDSDHSKMVQFFLMAKAALTGKVPSDIGTHGTIEVDSAA
jgi:general stress protein 26